MSNFSSISHHSLFFSSNYRLHEIVDHTEFPKTPCSICGKEFIEQKTLDYHILKKHTNKIEQQEPMQPRQNFKCKGCPYESKAESYYLQHLKKWPYHDLTNLEKPEVKKEEQFDQVYIPKEEKPPSPLKKLQIMPYSKFKEEFLKREPIPEVNEENFLGECPVCKKEFSALSRVRRHMVQVHMPRNENLKCEKCGKLFTMEKTLARYVSTMYICRYF